MKITVIGAGNAGTTVAAQLSYFGHEVTVLRTSNHLHNEHYALFKQTRIIKVIDEYLGDYTAQIHHVTESFEEAIPTAELIIVYVQTSYHEAVIKNMIPYLKDGQAILFEPGYLSTAFLLKYCNKDIISIEAESSPIDCRIIEPCLCKVLFKNVMNPMGVYPSNKKTVAAEILDKLGFPYRFTDNVVEAALHNPNLIVHTIGALFSIPRIEYTNGRYWMYKEVFTPHVWNVCESLDAEKMAVMSKVGVVKRQSYVEACQERNFVNDERSPLDSFFDYAMNSSPEGPSIPDSRYLTEDVPQGLVLLESLGIYLNVPTPTCSSLIDLASVALKIDFRACGRTVDKLGIENLSKIQNG
ncbi:MAG: NAD/NADP octopine/nopaline dehydrogenase family protein [Clostridia bacterium]|nr:NAD/NADP octopine/nopaline dehydrogenase family protein [Clostridia bacterium]